MDLSNLFYDTTHEEYHDYAFKTQAGTLNLKIRSLPQDEGQVNVIGKVVWPAAPALARYLCDHPDQIFQREVCELGCGTGIFQYCRISVCSKGCSGLAGIVAARLGSQRVVLSDGTEIVTLDWTGACPSHLYQAFDVILAADVIYGTNLMIRPLLNTIFSLLRPAPDSFAILANHPIRFNMHEEYFLQNAQEMGFAVNDIFQENEEKIRFHRLSLIHPKS